MVWIIIKLETHNMKHKIFKYLFAAVMLTLPFFASAQTLLLKSAKTTYQAGDSFQVTLSINTEGKQVNTIAGTVKTSNLQLLDVRYGSSILTLWVARPKINASAGTISFAGGLPGGFSGSSGPILSFGVRAKSEGLAEIKLSDFSILLNDGLGTEIKNPGLGSLKLNIQKAAPLPKATEGAAPPKKEIYIPTPDMTPPESFIPMISRHPSIAENRYFVSFSAVDKDSGIAYYEISERPWLISLFTKKFNKGPERSESPYILKIQNWLTEVKVSAYDQADNFAENSATKPPSTLLVVLGVIILLLGSIGVTFWLSTDRRKLPRKRVV